MLGASFKELYAAARLGRLSVLERLLARWTTGITGAAKCPSDFDGIVAGALALTGCASSSPVWSSTCSPSGVNASIREAR